MKLKKFTKNKKYKQIVIGSIVGILLLIGGITLYRTFALYKVEQSFDVLNGTVPDFSSGDVTLAFTVNGNKESVVAFPNKNEGFKVQEVSCENKVEADWDNDTWSLTNIKNPNSQSKIKCTINFKRYEEEILNGSYPVLKEGLVPVKIDESGNVTKADITTNWYKYADKEWANAVILTSDGEKQNFEDNDKIDEQYIESYFVWIPKYKYKLWDLGNTYTNITSESYQEKSRKIEIEFGTENTTDTNESCKTPMESGESGQCKVDDWMTHPAFISFDVNGFWVGKFETGYKDAKGTFNNQTNDSDIKNIVIKPNQYSWNNIKLANAYQASYNYGRGYDSHMMKSTEWGAVAYLSHSVYGTCENDGNCKAVFVNNNGKYITGFSSTVLYGSTAEANPNQDNDNTINYTNPLSQSASTTSNYSGIYDMSGGSREFTMGILIDSNNNLLFGDSEFNNDNFKIESKYYDRYKHTTTDKDYSYRILGDATGELGPFMIMNNRMIGSWYKSESYYINSVNNFPFLSYGGNCSHTTASIFTFHRSTGYTANNDNIYYSFRIVLAPKN